MDQNPSDALTKRTRALRNALIGAAVAVVALGGGYGAVAFAQNLQPAPADGVPEDVAEDVTESPTPTITPTETATPEPTPVVEQPSPGQEPYTPVPSDPNNPNSPPFPPPGSVPPPPPGPPTPEPRSED